MAGRALVLGGGGVTGVAWELGILAGLAEAGVDLTDADLVVGTSAGSVVGAQVTSGTPIEEFYERQLRPPAAEQAARVGLGLMLKLAAAALGSRDAQHARAKIGAMALAARTIPEQSRRAIIESRLVANDWPQRRLLITAVAADDGEFVVFDRDSGVSLVDAVGRQLRGAGRMAAGHHQRTPLHRRRDARTGQCGPRRRLRPRCGVGADLGRFSARIPGGGTGRGTAHRHADHGGRAQPGGEPSDRPQRARPVAAGVLGPRRQGTGGAGAGCCARGMDRLMPRGAAAPSAVRLRLKGCEDPSSAAGRHSRQRGRSGWSG